MNLLEIQDAADTVSDLYEELEARLLQNIIRHIRNYDQPIPSDEWLMQKLAEIGKLNKENLKLISGYFGQSQTAVQRMLNEMAEKILGGIEPGFKHIVQRGLAGEAVEAAKSKSVQKVVDALFKQAKDTLNLTNTTMLFKAQDAYKLLVQDTAKLAREILNKNVFQKLIAGQSRQQALRRTIQELNSNGIAGFIDRAGRSWTPEAYVNMTMRATTKNLSTEVLFARMDDHGLNLMSVTSHAGSRPKCARDQGKIFDRNNHSGYTKDLHGKKIRYFSLKDSSYGEPDGILGINCGHQAYPFIPGVNIQRYFPTEDMDANDRLYRQVQTQRGMERDIRKQKRLCMLYDEAGDSAAFEKAAVKLKEKEAKLRQYVNDNDQLHRRRDREQVVGFDKGVSARAVAAYKTNRRNEGEAVDESKIRQRNQKAAENWAKIHLGIKKTNYTKQPLEVVNKTNRALQRIYRENPILQDFIDEIEFKDINAVAQACIRVQNGRITTKLTFSTTKCMNENEIQKTINKQVADGFWTRKKGLYGIVKHEATHLSEYALVLKRYGVDKNSGGGDLARAVKAIKNHEISSQIRRKALKNCNLVDNYDIIKTNLCEYAAREGSGEFLAEACSEYQPRKLAKEVQRLFEEEMRK